MFIGLGKGVNKDFKDRYRNVMAILKEARMGWIEGDVNTVPWTAGEAPHSQRVEETVAIDKRIGSRGRMHMTASVPLLDRKWDYIWVMGEGLKRIRNV